MFSMVIPDVPDDELKYYHYVNIVTIRDSKKKNRKKLSDEPKSRFAWYETNQVLGL